MTYDPNVGRWLEDDPEEFEAGDSNLKRYVGNDPTDEIDPSGEQPPGYFKRHPYTPGPPLPDFQDQPVFRQGGGRAAIEYRATVHFSEGPGERISTSERLRREDVLNGLGAAVQQLLAARDLLKNKYGKAEKFWKNDDEQLQRHAGRFLFKDDNARQFYLDRINEVLDRLADPKYTIKVSLLPHQSPLNDGPAQTQLPLLGGNQGRVLQINPKSFDDSKRGRVNTMVHELGRYVPNRPFMAKGLPTKDTPIEDDILSWDNVIDYLSDNNYDIIGPGKRTPRPSIKER